MTGVLVFFPDLNFPPKNPSVGVLEFSLNKKRQPPSALLFFLLSHVEILMGVGLLPALVLIGIGCCLQLALTGAGQISLVPFSDNRPPMATQVSEVMASSFLSFLNDVLHIGRGPRSFKKKNYALVFGQVNSRSNNM